MGPAIVSTPRGRFQAVAESDGGATIACLAGRTRVVAGLRQPVLLGPDQSASVSSDGRTLVVMDRVSASSEDPVVIDLTDDAPPDEASTSSPAALAMAESAAVISSAGAEAPGVGLRNGSSAGVHEPRAEDADLSPGPDAVPLEAQPARLGWIPELVAVAALVAVLVAGVWIFTSDKDGDLASPPVATTAAPATTGAPTTTDAPTTTEQVEIGESATTEVVTPSTEPPRPTASGASAQGELGSCRRADGGVLATIVVTHQGGPASPFVATAALLDETGATFAEGSATSDSIAPGGSADVEVLVAFDGPAQGSCELVSVIATS